MAARGSKSKQQARTEAERARLYAARTAWHEGQIRRRVRDNTIAVVIGVLIIAGVIFSQVMQAQVNVPAPEPTPTVEPTEIPLPNETTGPEPVPTDGATDAPSE
jgi:hypothetical protein